jgi:hypothetical protein
MTPQGQRTTVSGSYEIDWKFTFDKVPSQDCFVVQEVPVMQDQKAGTFTKHYWEAWFVPAGGETPPFVQDHWHLGPSDKDEGNGHTHTIIKVFFKTHTGDLGDYRNLPAKPDPKTGWQAGDGQSWSIDLPWTDKEPTWWKDPPDNGEKVAAARVTTSWAYERVGRFTTPRFETLDAGAFILSGQ